MLKKKVIYVRDDEMEAKYFNFEVEKYIDIIMVSDVEEAQRVLDSRRDISGVIVINSYHYDQNGTGLDFLIKLADTNKYAFLALRSQCFKDDIVNEKGIHFFKVPGEGGDVILSAMKKAIG